MNGKVTNILVTVLCCGLAVLATIVAGNASMDEKYLTKEVFNEFTIRLERLQNENREDHQRIEATLHDMTLILIEGHTSNRPTKGN